MTTKYAGHYGTICDFCEEFASHICDVKDATTFVCPLHYIRTKVEHQASNHRELVSYTKWKRKNKKAKPEVEEALGMF